MCWLRDLCSSSLKRPDPRVAQTGANPISPGSAEHPAGFLAVFQRVPITKAPRLDSRHILPANREADARIRTADPFITRVDPGVAASPHQSLKALSVNQIGGPRRTAGSPKERRYVRLVFGRGVPQPNAIR